MGLWDKEIWFRRQSWAGVPGILPANWKGWAAMAVCGGVFFGLNWVNGKPPRSETVGAIAYIPLFVLLVLGARHSE